MEIRAQGSLVGRSCQSDRLMTRSLKSANLFIHLGDVEHQPALTLEGRTFKKNKKKTKQTKTKQKKKTSDFSLIPFFHTFTRTHPPICRLNTDFTNRSDINFFSASFPQHEIMLMRSAQYKVEHHYKASTHARAFTQTVCRHRNTQC